MLRARVVQSATRFRWTPFGEAASTLAMTRRVGHLPARFHGTLPEAVKLEATVYSDPQTAVQAAPVVPIDASEVGLLDLVFSLAHESLPGPQVLTGHSNC